MWCVENIDEEKVWKGITVGTHHNYTIGTYIKITGDQIFLSFICLRLLCFLRSDWPTDISNSGLFALWGNGSKRLCLRLLQKQMSRTKPSSITISAGSVHDWWHSRSRSDHALCKRHDCIAAWFIGSYYKKFIQYMPYGHLLFINFLSSHQNADALMPYTTVWHSVKSMLHM